MKKVQVLITDDHPIFRRGLKEILMSEIPGVVCVEADSAGQALALIRKQKWNALLLDINLPGRSGLEALKEIKLAQPALPVLIVSAASEEQYGARVLKLGASGYISKLSATRNIGEAVKALLAGDVYISSNLAMKIARRALAIAESPSQESLSEREIEVIRRLGAGKNTNEIASELSLSPATVSTYRTRALKKLGGRSTADLIRYAIENKLVEE